MKRFHQTLTAAAVATALAFGGISVANAQDLPATIELDGTVYTKQEDGSYVYTPEFGGNSVTLPAEKVDEIIKKQAPAEQPNMNNPATKTDTTGHVWYQHMQDKSFYVKDAALVNVDITDEMRDAYKKAFENAPAPETTPEKSPEQDSPALPATKKDSSGHEWYQHMQDKSLYVKDAALVNEDITDEMRTAYAQAFPEKTQEEAQKPGFDKKQLAWLALPAVLTIGGVLWYLSQDGKTYVKDKNRANQAPTAEEKAASEKMLAEHKDEVIAQGGKLDENAAANGGATDTATKETGRGMLAQTGSNTAARGLAALAITVMIAAAAVVSRRKLFA
ncbi:hypothetical protein [Corynebacterium auriscanis]|uniref:Secreted protein n=1 Tax=Corynebacterium auriscanis TaxID=99807 RepID=A0A0A2DPU3_9CORY|nr:hypothetical protein [Corynebacterium auriscanis]KGM18871.1 hypothetical protein MA47_04440 [Corynebacterium auriscanis]WJY73568.1 hypothetical protein CAURIC_09825 [Corynebacterium auriscanis]